MFYANSRISFFVTDEALLLNLLESDRRIWHLLLYYKKHHILLIFKSILFIAHKISELLKIC
ncbi:hypothetical protein CKA32_000933 [Geitlerinema sp. FC II]|nr:hypothetical protein CKA32_000933 [Geitlerinema sp. FC II]